MAGQALTNTLSALLVNRIPGWKQVALVGHLTDPPISGTDVGFELLKAPRMRLFASAKLVQDRRTGFIFIGPGGADTTATYTININAGGNSIFDAAAGGAASESDILNGIFDAVVASAYADFTIEQIQDTDGRTNGLLMYQDGSGDSGAPSTFVVTSFSSTGAGDMQVFAEADVFDLELWLTGSRGRSDGPPVDTHWLRVAEFKGTNEITRYGRWGFGPSQAVSVNGHVMDKLLDTAAAERVIAVISDFTLPGGDAAATQPAFYVHLGPSTDETVDLTAGAT